MHLAGISPVTNGDGTCERECKGENKVSSGSHAEVVDADSHPAPAHLPSTPDSDELNHGPLQTPQRAGTCYFRSINATLKFISRKIFHWDVAKTKRLMLTLRCAYLKAAEKQLNDIPGTASPPRATTALVMGTPLVEELQAPDIIDADAYFIRLGAQQTTRAAAKAVLRGHIKSPSVDRVVATVDSLLHALHQAANRVGFPEIASGQIPLPPKLGWTAKNALISDPEHIKDATLWPHFNLLATLGRMDTEVFAGSAAALRSNMFINLIAYKPGSKTNTEQLPSSSTAAMQDFRSEDTCWTFEDVEAALALANEQVSLKAISCRNLHSHQQFYSFPIFRRLLLSANVCKAWSLDSEQLQSTP